MIQWQNVQDHAAAANDQPLQQPRLRGSSCIRWLPAVFNAVRKGLDRSTNELISPSMVSIHNRINNVATANPRYRNCTGIHV